MNEADLLVADEIETCGELPDRSFAGRGVRAGYGAWNADPEAGTVSVSLGDSHNDEFWLDMRLDRATLRAMLEALPG